MSLFSKVMTIHLLMLSVTVESQDGILPIVDVHMHAMNSIWWRMANRMAMPRMCFPEPCEKIPAVVRNDVDIFNLTLEAMKKYNIVKGVISNYGFDHVMRWKNQAPDRFITGIMYGPPFPLKSGNSDVSTFHNEISKIRDELQNGNLKIIGEVSSQYWNYAIDDPALDPLFALAEEFDVPVHMHVAGLGGDPGFAINKGSPLRISEVLRKHPKLRVYVENAGWPFLEEITSLMYVYPNVYADLSTITWIIPKKTFHHYLRGLIDNGLDKRLMFGSDAMIWPEVIGLAIESIDSAPFLNREQKRDIFYNNAARFFCFDKEEIEAHHKNR